MPSRPSFLCHPLALAAQLALAAALAATAAAPRPAWAQQAGSAARSYDIPPGPLAKVLARFVGESGVFLAGTAELAQGRSSSGLQGSHTPESGLAALLAGSGLEAARAGDGSFVLRKAAVPAEAGPTSRTEPALPTVKVRARATRDETSEGTGSYTTPAAATSTKLNLSLRETPQSVSVITRQRIEDQGLTQLVDVIAQAPGLTMAQGGNAGSDSSPIYARGFQVDNYMIDGVRQVDSNYGDVAQTNDLALFDRVEVVRGATGLMNGLGLPGAAINLVRKRPTKEFQASGRVEAGSWNHRRVEADVSSALNASGSLRGRLVAAVQGNASYIDRLDERRYVLFGTLEADLSPSTVLRGGLSWQRHHADGHARGGLPAFYSDGTRTHWDRSDSAAAEWAYSERRNTTLFAALEHRFDDDWRLSGTASRSITFYDELLGYAAGGYPNRATGAGVNIWAGHWSAKPTQDVLDLYVSGKFSLLGRRHDLVAGLLSSRTTYDDRTYTNWTHAGWSSAIGNIYTWDGRTPAAPNNPATGTYDSDERLNSAYTTLRFKPVDGLSLLAGARVTNWSRVHSTTPYSTGVRNLTKRKESGQLTPYAGVVYDFAKEWSAYASYTGIFKPQNNRLVDGPFVDPLTGKSYEIGTKAAFFGDRLNFSAAIYRAKLENFAAAYSPTRYVVAPDVAPNAVTAYYVVPGTVARGWELELSGELQRGWQLSAGYGHNKVRNYLGVSPITNVPEDTFKLFTSYRIAGVGNGLTLGGGLRWQSDIYQNRMGPSLVRQVQQAYTVVDAMARYPLTGRLTASVNVYNLFDTVYLNNTGTSYYGAPRNLKVSLEARF